MSDVQVAVQYVRCVEGQHPCSSNTWGCLGAVLDRYLPCLLPECVHLYDVVMIVLGGSTSKMDVYVTHATIERFRVQKATMGLHGGAISHFLMGVTSLVCDLNTFTCMTVVRQARWRCLLHVS